MSQADDDTRKQVEMAGIRQLQDALAAKDILAKIQAIKW